MATNKAETKTALETEVETEVETTAVAETAEQEVTTDTGSVETGGTRARRALVLKQFLPNPDWINVNIVAGGKGTRGTIGRIFGIATGFDRKMNTLPDGSVSESIFVKGMFQSEGYITGELAEASGVYFPMAYAEKIAAAFEGLGVKSVEVDCDIGLEATGKTIPYEWVVVAFREGQEMDALKRIRGTRKRPPALLVSADGKPKELAAPEAQKALPSS